MSMAERADLVARLSLQDNLSRQSARAASNFSKSMGKIGSSARKGVGTAATNIGRIGIIAAGAITVAVKGGLSSLAELESATVSVDAAIKQMGMTGEVTGAQVATWANEIEASIGAAFDDKAITQAATTLLRFGKVTTDNLRPALVVMTDLATKTGSVEGAATLLAKALAAPEKAAGKLARAGVILTKEQQKQIAALVKAGKVGEAQKLILDELTKATKGAAAASQGPYARSLSVLKDVTEDAQRALATGFLPVIEKVAKILSTELAKPETLTRIKEFGTGLAGGLDKLVDAARGVDWNAIGAGLKTAGAGAKAVFDAFAGMPDWVKTAVVTGWGLNKLTGGAVGDIIGTGLEVSLKGIFSQFFARGASPANPMWVASAGGAGGAGGAVPAGKTGIGTLGKLFLVGEAIGLVAAVIGVGQSVRDAATAQAQGVGATLKESLAGPQTVADLQMKLDAINTGIARLKADPIAAALITGPTIAELERQRQTVLDAQSAAAMNAHRIGERTDAAKDAVNRVRDRAEANRIAIVSATNASKSAIVSSVNSDRNAIVSAIRNNRPIVTVNVKVNAGDTIRVTKNYQTGTTLGRPGGPSTGGQQEYG